MKALATNRQQFLTSYILHSFDFISTENMMIIITQAADEVCRHPSICRFSCDNFGVAVLSFYFIAAPEKSSHHLVLFTRIVSTNISIFLTIEKELLILFGPIILLSDIIIKLYVSTASTIITIHPIIEL